MANVFKVPEVSLSQPRTPLTMLDSSTGKLRLAAKISGYALLVIVLLAFAGLAAFAVLSDNSVHGLSVRFYDVTWTCANTTSSSPVLTFKFGSVAVYSSNSLTTTLTHVSFSMSTNGVVVASSTAPDASFGPNQSAPYTLSFSNPALDPHSQSLSSQIGLTVNAQVSAGFYSSLASASYSQVVYFSSLAC